MNRRLLKRGGCPAQVQHPGFFKLFEAKTSSHLGRLPAVLQLHKISKSQNYQILYTSRRKYANPNMPKFNPNSLHPRLLSRLAGLIPTLREVFIPVLGALPPRTPPFFCFPYMAPYSPGARDSPSLAGHGPVSPDLATRKPSKTCLGWPTEP